MIYFGTQWAYILVLYVLFRVLHHVYCVVIMWLVEAFVTCYWLIVSLAVLLLQQPPSTVRWMYSASCWMKQGFIGLFVLRDNVLPVVDFATNPLPVLVSTTHIGSIHLWIYSVGVYTFYYSQSVFFGLQGLFPLLCSMHLLNQRIVISLSSHVPVVIPYRRNVFWRFAASGCIFRFHFLWLAMAIGPEKCRS